MSVTLTLTDEQVRDWLARVAVAVDIDGSNDAEHDLLIEIADDLGAALPNRFATFSENELAALAQGMRDLAHAPGHLAVTADRLHDEVQTAIDDASPSTELES